MIAGIRAWIALREDKFAEAYEIIVPSLAEYKKTPQFTMTPWVVVWPLVAILIHKGDFDEAILYIETMLTPTARPQPAGLSELLQEFVENWKRRDIQQAQQKLNQATIIAKQLNYI